MATVPVPRTYVASELLDATIMNGNGGPSAGLNFLLDPPRALAYQGTTGTSLVSGTTTVLPFDTEVWDTDTIHSTSSNTSRMTFTTAGRYLIIATLGLPASAAGIRTLTIRRNAAGAPAGGTLLSGNSMNAPASGSCLIQAVWEDSFAAGDYVECFANQTSGGALTTVLGIGQTGCTVRRLSA